MSRELAFSVSIKDCDVQTFSAGGKGGQHQNKTQSGVRVIHRPSGAVGEARDSRSQHQNRRAAFARMAQTRRFQMWAKIAGMAAPTRQSVEAAVDAALAPENLRIETRDDRGRWVV